MANKLGFEGLENSPFQQEVDALLLAVMGWPITSGQKNMTRVRKAKDFFRFWFVDQGVEASCRFLVYCLEHSGNRNK